MIQLVKQSAEDRYALFQYTANELKMSEAIVEKDFWVCFMLEVLFEHSPYKDYFAFKGGTSLSKSFELIERFSEDIDLILDWRKLGYATREPLETRSNTAQERFKKEMNAKCEAFLKDEFIPTMQQDLSTLCPQEQFTFTIDEVDPQTVLVGYPKNYDDAAIVKEIRLEIGPLAAWTPVSNYNLHAYVYDAPDLPFETKSITVPTVEVARTFWEKATILHAEAHRPETKPLPPRYSRHYYDVYMMQRNPNVWDTIVANKALLEKVIDFKQRFYRLNWAQYEKALNGELVLVPTDEVSLKGLKSDYASMQNMLFGEQPTFEEILETLKALQVQLNEVL